MADTAVSCESLSHPSVSKAQSVCERALLLRLHKRHPEWEPMSWKDIAEKLGLSKTFQKAKPDAIWMTKDGVVVVAECYARIRPANPGSERKIALDALKLSHIRKSTTERVRCLLVLPSQGEFFRRDGWLREAIENVAEIVREELSEYELRLLQQAGHKQADGQSRTRRSSRLGTQTQKDRKRI